MAQAIGCSFAVVSVGDCPSAVFVWAWRDVLPAACAQSPLAAARMSECE
ncbi:hypothetical protein FHT08_001784 [Xanthomonas campestris]|nr:hypothetical protein [Xanthomonas sp. CFBP 8151]